MAQKLYEEILTNVPGAIIETQIGAEGEKMFLFRDFHVTNWQGLSYF